MTNPPQPTTHSLAPVTLESVVTSALDSTMGAGRHPVAPQVDAVATAVRLWFRGERREGVTSLEESLTRSLAAHGVPSTSVRRGVRAVVAALQDAQVAGLEYETLRCERLGVRDPDNLQTAPADQREYVLLQYVEAAHRRTAAVRAHLMGELDARDETIRYLQGVVADLQAEVGR